MPLQLSAPQTHCKVFFNAKLYIYIFIKWYDFYIKNTFCIVTFEVELQIIFLSPIVLLPEKKRILRLHEPMITRKREKEIMNYIHIYIYLNV